MFIFFKRLPQSVVLLLILFAGFLPFFLFLCYPGIRIGNKFTEITMITAGFAPLMTLMWFFVVMTSFLRKRNSSVRNWVLLDASVIFITENIPRKNFFKRSAITNFISDNFILFCNCGEFITIGTKSGYFFHIVFGFFVLKLFG